MLPAGARYAASGHFFASRFVILADCRRWSFIASVFKAMIFAENHAGWARPALFARHRASLTSTLSDSIKGDAEARRIDWRGDAFFAGKSPKRNRFHDWAWQYLSPAPASQVIGHQLFRRLSVDAPMILPPLCRHCVRIVNNCQRDMVNSLIMIDVSPAAGYAAARLTTRAL